MASIAYLGVRAEVKPVPWLYPSLLVFFLSLLGSLAWAYHPVAARLQSAPLRYLVKSLGVIVTFIVMAFLSYAIFIHFCVLFG
jgi:uncharacterized membrane protein